MTAIEPSTSSDPLAARFWTSRQLTEQLASVLSAEAQELRLNTLDLDIELGEGAEIRAEISTKFRPEKLGQELADVGFQLAHMWKAENDDFGLALAKRL